MESDNRLSRNLRCFLAFDAETTKKETQSLIHFSLWSLYKPLTLRMWNRYQERIFFSCSGIGGGGIYCAPRVENYRILVRVLSINALFHGLSHNHLLEILSSAKYIGFIHLKWLSIFEFPKIWKIALRIFQIFEKPFSNFEFCFEKYVKQYLDAYIFGGKCASHSQLNWIHQLQCALSPKILSI